MAVFLSPVGGVAAQFFDNNGNPLSGGRLYTYLAGTTTPAATYTTSLGNTAWTNPIVLDAAGRVPGSGEIWLTDGIIYKFVVKDSSDVLIATYDNITGINSNFVNFTAEQEIQTATAGQTVFTLANIEYQPGTNSLSVFVDGVNQYGPGAQYAYEETDSTTVTFVDGLHVGASVKFTTAIQVTGNATDAAVVAYTPPFANSVTTTVEDKLAQTINALDFGAVADGTTNNTSAVQDALDALPTAGGLVEIPAGCRFDLTALTFRQNCNMQYYSNDDLSTPGPFFDIGSGELVYFSANSSYPTDPSGAAVNEWRFTAAFHPGIVVDVRKDVDGANAYLAPGQTLSEPARASWNMMDEQTPSFTTLYQNYSSNSNFSGVSQNTYRRVVTLNGVGTANWPTLPTSGNLVTGSTSGASGFVISVDSSSTVLLWFSGKFVAGENLILASPLSVSTSAVSSVAFTATQMPPLSQDFLRGGWSVALPPQVVTDSFAVGGRIVSTPTRASGQYTETVVTDPGFGFKSSYETNIRGRYMVADSATDFKRVVLRNLTTTANIANVGACIAHNLFAGSGGISSSSFNVASMTKSATGVYDVVFINPASRDDYTVTVTTGAALDYGFVTNRTVNGFTVNIVQTGTATAKDVSALASFACFGGDI